MNCDKCCGCVPPITTYNPSVADNFPTILQQVEYLKALLKKYPSQQWFITQEEVTEDTIKLDSTKVSLRGRAIAEGDFILGNTEGGTTLMFQYTGATNELTNYVVEFVGVYSNQGLAEQALSLAQTNEQDIAKLDSEIIEKVDKIPKGLKYRVYAIEDIYGSPLSYLEVTNYPIIGQIPNYTKNGTLKGNEAKEDEDYVNFHQFKVSKSKIIKLHKKDINDGAKDNEVAGFFFADGEYSPTFETYIKRQTGEYYVKMPLPVIKTIFGNQNLFGTGNIDLYNHFIRISGNTATGDVVNIYFTHISSNGLKVDSLTDLKTLLGPTFTKEVSGAYGRESFTQILYITENGFSTFTSNTTFASMTGLTISDTLTTI